MEAVIPNDRKATEDIDYHQLSTKRDGLPFAIISSGDPHFRPDNLLRPSIRDFHVILWFIKGNGTYYIDFKPHQFQENTITLIAKDQLHYLEAPEGDWEILSIVFNSDFIYRNDQDLQHLFNFNISRHIEGQQILKLRSPDVEFLQEVSKYMTVVYQEWEGDARENAFYHWLCIFLIYCERLQDQYQTLPRPIIDSDTKILLQFNELLEENFRTNFKVNFYVARLNLSLKTLSRITRNRYKLSPKAVIDERRILEIKRLLSGSNKSVKEIAYQIGFDEPTNLVKYFKKHTGLTPSSFKKQG